MYNYAKSAFALLILISLVHCIDTTGGNVTNLELSRFSNSTRWDGVYGEVILGAGTNYTYTVTGNKVARINIIAQDPPCTYVSLSIHIIAYNASSITLPLTPGNIAKLDTFIGNQTENATLTFKNTSNFTLSTGTYIGVPTTYTYANSTSSSDFRMGYLKDAAGNLVFITKVVSNKPDWNGSTSDYQIMLPRSTGPIGYNITADVIYTCQPTPGPGPSGGGDVHRLYIYPINTVQSKKSVPFQLNAIVKNTGGFNEKDISVFVEMCPVGFSCGQALLPELSKGKSNNVTIQLTAEAAGEYVLSICAKSAYTKYCREVIVIILPECSADFECDTQEYCSAGVCLPKKPVKEKCTAGNECKSNLCIGGYCAECESNSDCPANEQCSAGVCSKIPCSCGTIKNHECVQYECCEDSMCSGEKVCVASKCVEKEIALLLVKGELIEGQDVLVRVENNKGEPVPFAVITTEDGQVRTADENGYSTVRVPYDGLIRATAEGYPQAGILLDVTRLGFITVEGTVYAGIPAKITIKDSKGKPLANAIIRVNGKEYITNAKGEVWIVFDSAGRFVLSGVKDKYLIANAEINVVEAGKGACGFPIILSVLWFLPKDIWVLWIISTFVAFINIAIYVQRKREGRKLRAIIYFLLPLALAIPDVYVFSICFMSNIVILQFAIELLIILRNRLVHHHKSNARNKNKE